MEIFQNYGISQARMHSSTQVQNDSSRMNTGNFIRSQTEHDMGDETNINQ